MNYDIAPKELNVSGKKYSLTIKEYTEKPFEGWWSYMYTEKGKHNSFPPEATDGHDIYYLCSMSFTKQKAEEEILEKINNMKRIVTFDDKKEMIKKQYKKR